MTIPDRHTPETLPPATLAHLRANPEEIDARRAALYVHLAVKLADLEALSDDEIALLGHFPELDSERAVRVTIDEAWLHEAARLPHDLEGDAFHAVSLYLADKLTDGETLSEDESALAGHVFAPDSSIDRDMRLTADPHAPLSAAEAVEEYGYDIYDYHALILRLADIHGRTMRGDHRHTDPMPVLPLSRREVRVIKRAWEFDPQNTVFTQELLDSYEDGWLHPAMEGEHARRIGRYRNAQVFSATSGYREEGGGV